MLSDHAAVLEQLLDHLATAGAQHIALLASSTVTDWGRTLQRTYLGWSERHRRRPRLWEMAFGSPSTVMQDNVRALLNADADVDALVCAPDGAAAAVLPVIRAAGRTIGRDLLLASCVDSTALAHPPITAIDLRPRDAGDSRARLLFAS
ncbi:substrate-binding domain-containing protein [Amycolatopsis tucumanensis]|uniref:Transcriptional regulator LacI/GalR-like sensor domain-containing protein n=1 Tax=Amycolatopsis tucumanensis TaxID=401106 RepID=A0ABP7JLF6_9PSEU|nr:substrate-binding domain-containing protein [Amycolatopsis tucumanensis]MCF6427927.1 substrate-binding domain-containing protein [Amycolatopsis tucumanensis]